MRDESAEWPGRRSGPTCISHYHSDGKPTKHKMESHIKDADNIVSKMSMGEGAGAMTFEIVYKRKK